MPARHHRLLIRELEAAYRGEHDRVMIFMPPNSAKTTYASVLFTPWFMAQQPNTFVIGASHGSEYAMDLSKAILSRVREHADLLGYGLINDAADLWRTTNGGTYRAAGAGGSITGRRADLFIIDDPIKGREDADSEKIREKVWKWYQAEVLTRLNPGARVILIQTRWHQDDLAGRLLQEMEAGGDQWRIVNLPAVADDENDIMGRAPGEALWPERFPLEVLERTRRAVGEREWASLYQQNPRPMDGALFQVGRIEVLEVAPQLRGAYIGRGWDLAGTRQIGTRDPDWTVGVLMARMQSGQYVVLDVTRFRGDPNEVDNIIHNTARQDGAGVTQSLPEDPGQAGKAQALAFTRLLSGLRVETSRETGDKATRAAPFISQVNGGNVAIVRAPWNRAFLEELGAFPQGSKDDQVDACSRAFGLVGLGARPLIVSENVLAVLGQR